MDGQRPEPHPLPQTMLLTLPVLGEGPGWLSYSGDFCWRQPLLSALEMLLSQLETVSKVKDMFRKPSLLFAAVEMKIDGAATAPAAFLIRDLRRSGQMSWSGMLFEGPDSAASLKCPFSCLLKGPCGSQRQAHCRVN